MALHNPFPLPTPHYHITWGLFTAISFTQYIMSGYQKKKKKLQKERKEGRHNKWQKIQFEETKQESKPKMAGILELSDLELKTSAVMS